MKVVFFGTPSFAAEVLEILVDNNIDVVAVVTRPDRAKGRSGTPVPTPVKVIAQQRLPDVPVYQPEKVSTPECRDTLAACDADLFVVVAYGEIISQAILDVPSKDCINVHASLLPKYRGAAPIQRCLMNGDTLTGITIMQMVKKMDAGDIIKTAQVPVEPNMNAGQLEIQLRHAGAQCLLEVLDQYQQGAVVASPQDHFLATYAPKVELEDCQIDWNNNAQDIHNLIRGVTPQPGAWCDVNFKGQQRRLKVTESSVEPDASAPPATIVSYDKSGVVVACQQQGVRLRQLQLEGKKMMDAQAFSSGVPQKLLSFL